jgi:hydrogenase maturation protease
LSDQVLVAGIGNIFFRDDGFGPAVAAALLSASGAWPIPESVRVVDYGIRGVHLSYDLLAGVDALILIDAVAVGTAGQTTSGAVLTLCIDPEKVAQGDGGNLDAHGLSSVEVLASLVRMGGTLPPAFLIGCIPGEVGEGIGLTPPVQAAIAPAARAVHELLGRLAERQADAVRAQLGG